MSASILATAGLALALWAVLLFRRAGTGIPVHHRVTSLVTSGPYRWSRNPIYVALILVYAAATVALDTAWPLVLLPVVVAALHHLVIRREERLLAGLFGEAYRDYAARVRRWF
ncbi:MAG: isoprenylcysteine carboxylmethyltransferase family protein [Alphaproteobacteria bacterium]|nr:isoprenylcysteine carboxylmethyltransferase family protein [Alphaproteobacteria bacterium]